MAYGFIEDPYGNQHYVDLNNQAAVDAILNPRTSPFGAAWNTASGEELYTPLANVARAQYDRSMQEAAPATLGSLAGTQWESIGSQYDSPVNRARELAAAGYTVNAPTSIGGAAGDFPLAGGDFYMLPGSNKAYVNVNGNYIPFEDWYEDTLNWAEGRRADNKIFGAIPDDSELLVGLAMAAAGAGIGAHAAGLGAGGTGGTSAFGGLEMPIAPDNWFELGASGYGGSASAGLDAAAAEWGAATGGAGGFGGMDIPIEGSGFPGDPSNIPGTGSSVPTDFGPGTMDTYGSVNSPTGSGTGGTIFQQPGTGGGFWDKLMNTVSKGATSVLNSMGGGSGGTGFDAGRFLTGLMNWLSGSDDADELRRAGLQAAQLSDPFASQRPFYQQQLMQSYTDPNYFANNPVFRGLQDYAVNQTNRSMAAQGYNMSGNQMEELTRTATNEGFKYAMPFQQQTGQFAGAGISPGYAGYLAQQGAQNAINAQTQANGGLGVAIGQGINILRSLV